MLHKRMPPGFSILRRAPPGQTIEMPLSTGMTWRSTVKHPSVYPPDGSQGQGPRRNRCSAQEGGHPAATGKLTDEVGQGSFFQVAPLVSPGGTVSMPKPSDDYGKWSWAYRPQVTKWIEVETLTATADQAGFAPQP